MITNLISLGVLFFFIAFFIKLYIWKISIKYRFKFVVPGYIKKGITLITLVIIILISVNLMNKNKIEDYLLDYVYFITIYLFVIFYNFYYQYWYITKKVIVYNFRFIKKKDIDEIKYNGNNIEIRYSDFFGNYCNILVNKNKMCKIENVLSNYLKSEEST